MNYEEFCIHIIESVTSNINVEEFINYWKWWHTKFSKKKKTESRNELFKACILDLKNKWLLPSDTSGLTGNFSSKIAEILENNPIE